MGRQDLGMIVGLGFNHGEFSIVLWLIHVGEPQKTGGLDGPWDKKCQR